MALTFLSEALIALYVISRYGYRRIELKLIIALLSLLAVFQLSEYGVCEGLIFDSVAWAKLGFLSITLLPSLGMHLTQRVREDKNLIWSYVAYALAFVFVLTFTFFDGFSSIGCGDNYAIFVLKPVLGGAYFTYYYMIILVTIGLCLDGYRRQPQPARRQIFLAITIGYLSFIVPASIIHLLYKNAANGGLPSIMCGFALIFAMILGFYIAPRIAQLQASKR